MSCAPTAIVRSATTRGTTCNPDLASSADHFIDISTMVVHFHLGADVRAGRHGLLDHARRTRPSRLRLPTDSPSLLLNYLPSSHYAPTIQVPAVAAVALQTSAMAAPRRSGDTLRRPLRGVPLGSADVTCYGRKAFS